MRVFLGLGSNLGDRVGHLQAAVAALPDVVAVSPLFESEPVGGPEQGPFLNLVVQLDTDVLPHRLLERCLEIESRAGRVRAERWGPRTLDIDILWIDGVRIDSWDLVVPHPRMHERNFVMAPLLALDPSFEHPRFDPATASGEVVIVGQLPPSDTAAEDFRR